MREGEGWRAVAFAELEEIPWLGAGPTWRPIRGALDARIVGMSVYTARHAGEQVIEAHTEAGAEGRGHEEVYVVLAGKARFELDGRELEVQPGTFVRVAPSVRRGATALADETAVLALGGPATFEPSASEWIERARVHVRTDPARAREIVAELRAEQEDQVGVWIAEALLAEVAGEREQAAAKLAEVVRREPELAEHLARDPDLAAALADAERGQP